MCKAKLIFRLLLESKFNFFITKRIKKFSSAKMINTKKQEKTKARKRVKIDALALCIIAFNFRAKIEIFCSPKGPPWGIQFSAKITLYENEKIFKKFFQMWPIRKKRHFFKISFIAGKLGEKPKNEKFLTFFMIVLLGLNRRDCDSKRRSQEGRYGNAIENEKSRPFQLRENLKGKKVRPVTLKKTSYKAGKKFENFQILEIFKIS